MRNNSIEETFKECGAIMEGHFVLSSLEHSGTYLEKVELYRNPVIFEHLCQVLAKGVSSKFINIEAVAGPMPIGSVLAQRVAFYLGETYHKMVVPLFTEKDGTGEHLFRRGFDKDLAGKNVLVVDDIMTSGRQVGQIIKAVTLSRGRVVAVAVICNRGGVASANLYGFVILSLLNMKAWRENDCLLCKAKVPIDADIGRGREFLSSHPGYPSK